MCCTCHILVHWQSGCGAAEQPSGDSGGDEKNTGEWKEPDRTPFKILHFFHIFPYPHHLIGHDSTLSTFFYFIFFILKSVYFLALRS